MDKAIKILTEFLRLVDEEGLDLRELCEQTDLLKKHTLTTLQAHKAKIESLKEWCNKNKTTDNYDEGSCDEVWARGYERGYEDSKNDTLKNILQKLEELKRLNTKQA